MLIRGREAVDLREGRAVPAVDLLGGRVVRLEQGRYDRVTAYPVEPAALARAYAEAGAPWLHVVDLDAARSGERSPEHAALLRELRAVPGLRIQLGGGLRSEAEIRAALADAADRVIVGTLAAAEPDLVGRLAAETGRLVAGLDCLDGRLQRRAARRRRARPGGAVGGGDGPSRRRPRLPGRPGADARLARGGRARAGRPRRQPRGRGRPRLPRHRDRPRRHRPWAGRR